MLDKTKKWGIASREVFQISLVTYLILLILETVKSGLISNFINTNYIIPVIIVSGIAMTLTDQEEVSTQKKKKMTELDIYFILAISAGSGLLVYFKTVDLGWIAVVISSTTALIIALLAVLIFLEETTKEKNNSQNT